MNSQFHKNLNRMALFTTMVVCAVTLCHQPFLRIATTNIWLNGIIIGTTVFGMGLCFVDIFKLLPEYRWLKKYFYNNEKAPLPPRVLKPIAMMLQGQKQNISVYPNTINNFLDIIVSRFEDQRESVRYITNTLIFLGLLGTFWGLIHTVGGFSELINSLNFEDESVMTALQVGLSGPLAGMAVAFTSSLFGLAGSLVVGFLGLQVQMAQNAIFRELEENLASRSKMMETDIAISTLPEVNKATKELTKAVAKLEKTVAQLT